MQVIEQFLLSKRGEPTGGDDAIVVAPHFAAVIDGATAKSVVQYGVGLTSGAFAAAMVAEVVPTLPADCTALEAVQRITAQFQDYYTRKNLVLQLSHAPYERPAASVLIYSAARREVWSIGDCQARIAGVEVRHDKAIDQVLAAARAVAIEMELAGGALASELAKHDIGREFILPLLRRQSLFQNTTSDSPYAYGVIDGFPVPERFITVHPLPDGPQDLVLTSDGYPSATSTLAEGEALLERYLAVDPLCARYLPRTKGRETGSVSFDDRAYLRLRIP